MDDDLSALVERIYDALLDDSAVDALTARLATAFGATSGWFPIVDPATGSMRTVGPYNVDPAAAEPYERYYHAMDPWLAASLRIPPDRIMRSEFHITPSDFKRSELFTDYVRRYFSNATYCLGVRMPIGREIAYLGLHRQDGLGPFGGTADRALDRLIPPIKRVLKVRRAFEDVNGRVLDLEATLDRIPFGLARCDGKARILHLNAGAHELIRRGDGVAGRTGGILSAEDPTINQTLHAFIGRAAATRTPSSGALLAPRAIGRPLRIVVVPFRRPGAAPQALVLIQDPEAQDPDLPRLLRQLYGLTGAEADVAVALSLGVTPEEHADARKVSMPTVRTQIQSALNKTGARRQVDLAALVASLPAASR